MKKWILIVVAVFSCSATFADGPEKTETLLSKVVMQNTNGFFVLSDGSCWKAMGFARRWRSLGEWWNGVQLAPEKYECVPNDWYPGAQIEVYPKYGNLDVSEANASNQEALKQCTHLLLNTKNGQVLFAIALKLEDCVVSILQ